MGHYDSCYEEDDRKMAEERRKNRERLLALIRVEIATMPLEEILVKIVEGEYKR